MLIFEHISYLNTETYNNPLNFINIVRIKGMFMQDNRDKIKKSTDLMSNIKTGNIFSLRQVVLFN